MWSQYYFLESLNLVPKEGLESEQVLLRASEDTVKRSEWQRVRLMFYGAQGGTRTLTPCGTGF